MPPSALPKVIRVGQTVWYRAHRNATPDYGVVTSLHAMPSYIHVRFGLDLHAKACRPCDLNYPPDYCEKNDDQ